MLKKKSKITKRQRFVIVTLWLTILLLFIQIVSIRYRYLMISVFALLTYLSSIWAINEDIQGIKWFNLFVLPTLFSTGISFFYFLLPVRWLTRLPFTILYGVSIYAIFLSENIFNIAAIRTIQLHQAAQAVASFLSILTFFLFGNIIRSLHFNSLINFVLYFLLSFVFLLVNLWHINLESYLEKKLVKISFYLAIIIAEISFILTFWPVTPVISSLFITTIFYLILGMMQTDFSEKPLGKLIWEYSLLILTFLILIFRGNGGS